MITGQSADTRFYLCGYVFCFLVLVSSWDFQRICWLYIAWEEIFCGPYRCGHWGFQINIFLNIGNNTGIRMDLESEEDHRKEDGSAFHQDLLI